MNAKDAWLATLGQLQIQLNRSTYDTWLRHADLLGYEDGRFVVTVPHAYAKDWIERHLLASMTRTLSDIFQRESEIQVIVWDPIEEDDVPLLESLDAPVQANALAALNPAYTFANFVVGEANHYASLLAKAVVENAPGKYSPVLFYGDMGVGKTHLLQAITRSLLERGDNAIYVSAEDFTNEMVTAIRDKENLAFREKYRTADGVIIDDLQFVEGKVGTQNEIVAIWDALRNRQKTIIFASNRLPVDMAKVSKDARSRFQAGPIATLELPDSRLRHNILEADLKRRGLQLPAEVREMIIGQANASARDLQGAIEQLHTYAQLTRQIITPAVAQTILKSFGTPAVVHNKATLDAVLEATAAYYHLTTAELASRQRTKIVALARQMAMYLAREETGASLLQIGAALGGRDHSTVMHGCAHIAELLASDPAIAQDAAAIRQSLSGQSQNMAEYTRPREKQRN